MTGGGYDEKKLLRQKREIARFNKKIKGITILSGAEINIMKDGTLDIDNEVLVQLDVVGISVHSHFNLSRDETASRIMKATSNPHADILFHPMGRRIHKRPAYGVDMVAIIAHAKNRGTILGIDALSSRLDLKDEHIRMAVEAGVRMCINTDAHVREHVHYLEYGIAQARRGWASKKDIINTLPFQKFLASLKDAGK